LIIGVLGDIHGGISALRRALNWLLGYDLEALLCVGDFVPLASDLDVLQELYVLEEVMELLNDVGVPVMYVWGNRDLELFERVVSLEDLSSRRECLKVIDRIIKMRNLIEVPRDTRIRLGDTIYVTRNPMLLDSRTIYLTHYDNYLRSCLLHVEGHVHYAQIAKGYINAGYIHRNLPKGAYADGMVIAADIAGSNNVRVLVKPLGAVKPLICAKHISEGVFFVPSNWRLCPVCYDFAKAKVSRVALHI